MRHTFIPKSERAVLDREYHARAFSALCAALASAVIVGAVALFPAFIKVSLTEKSALETVAAVRSGSPSDAQVIQGELSADGKLVSLLAASGGASRLSDAIRQILLVRSRVTLTSVTVDREGTSSVSAVLQGVAPTRDELISFKSRLQGLAPGAAVDLPIGELAKSTDVGFSISLVARLP